MLSVIGVRTTLAGGALDVPAVTAGFAVALALVVLAVLDAAARWRLSVALASVAAVVLWASASVDALLAGAVAVALLVALVLASPPLRRLEALGGGALLAVAVRLAAPGVEPAGNVALALATASVLVFLFAAARTRALPHAILAAAIVSAVVQRHFVVASSSLAPDDALALAAAPALALLAVARVPEPRRDALAAAAAIAALVLVGAIALLVRPYEVDAVVAPHHAADLLLSGRNPYAAFDMREALDRFGLTPELATQLQGGDRLASLNYPAGAFLIVTPLVAAGVPDIRWLYLAGLALLALLLFARLPSSTRMLGVAAVVGSGFALRQQVLAGTDPTWALGVAVALLFFEREWLSPTALGLATAVRQLAWFVVPFYLVVVWRLRGLSVALRRGAVVLVAFAALNLPFFVASPSAYLGSVLAPMVGPLEPYGVGVVRFGILGVTALFPREAYLAATVVAFVLLVALVWRGPRGTATLALVPLFFAWRSLVNYFVLLPALALVDGATPSRQASPSASLSRQRALEVAAMPVDKELLEILACPVDKEPVREEGDRLVCTKCGRRYPVRDGIPVMLVEEAEPPA